MREVYSFVKTFRKERKMTKNSITDNTTTYSDQEIITLFWNRDETAIKATDIKYGNYLYTIAYNILSSGLDSEECLNDTYLGAWNSIPPHKPSAFLVFLSKIMRNISLGRFRKMTAARRIPPEIIVSLEELDEWAAFEPGEDEKYYIHQLSRLLNEYIRTLSDRQMFIFVCRYYYSDTVIKIAQMLKMSERTVSRELSAIRQGLKKHLAEGGIEV